MKYFYSLKSNWKQLLFLHRHLAIWDSLTQLWCFSHFYFSIKCNWILMILLLKIMKVHTTQRHWLHFQLFFTTFDHLSMPHEYINIYVCVCIYTFYRVQFIIIFSIVNGLHPMPNPHRIFYSNKQKFMMCAPCYWNAAAIVLLLCTNFNRLESNSHISCVYLCVAVVVVVVDDTRSRMSILYIISVFLCVFFWC